MKITIDARPAMLPKTGIGHYTDNLIRQFPRVAPQHDYYLCDVFAGMGFYNMIPLNRSPSDDARFFNPFEMPFPFVTLTRLFLNLKSKLLGDATRIAETDLFFGSNFRGMFGEDFKTVITIHDMAHEYFPETIKDHETFHYLKNELPEVARKANRIIADSEATRTDIIRFLDVPPEKVIIVYLGVDRAFRPISNQIMLDAVRARYRLPARFILFVGAIQPRKNITGLIEAYARICGDASIPQDLVIAGGEGWKSEGLTELIRTLGIGDRIHFIGYVNDSDLPLLYNLADLFAFPSLYEGFGLPVLEAMACGIPVVTSNTSSLPEVAGDAAVLVNPASVDNIATGMKQALVDHDLRMSCSAKGLAQAKLFTWEQCARNTLAVFQDALDAP